jgi:nucleoside-diphosphate-sugar epimerase
MHLFLTGATGFVGLNLLIEALRSGRYVEIVTPVRDPDKLKRRLAEEGFVEPPAQLRITGWTESVPEEIDHVVHCAGTLFARERSAYFRVNVDDTLRLLSALPSSARILALSSLSAGGPTPPGRQMRTPADPDTPITWYGESKLAMEAGLHTARPDAQIWRPPMILGPRDRATLPLFQMAAAPLRIKPGLHAKSYSWIAVGDLVKAILGALSAPSWFPSPPLSVCAPDTITDLELIEAAAKVMGRRGHSIPMPHLFMRGISAVVDAIPALRTAAPSLTRDRAREIFPNRWVVDGAEFRSRFAPGPFATLSETLAETHAWYLHSGQLHAQAA